MPPSVQTNDVGDVEYGTSTDEVAKGDDSLDCDEVSIRPAKNGGFVATARYKPKDSGGKHGPRYVEPDTYAFGGPDELVAFLTKTFGGSDVAAEQAAPPPSAAPAGLPSAV